MAKVLVAGGGIFAGPLGAYLREALPDDLSVVVGLVVRHYPLDAVVVGPAGLAVLRAEDGPGGAIEARPDRYDPRSDGARASKALGLFLADEFAALRSLQVTCLRVAPPANGDDFWRVVEPDAMKDQNLAHTLMSAQQQPDPAFGDPELRNSLAVALRDRQLTSNERASQPFVFRSRRAMGTAVRAWTIRAAVEHMDRHPEDGIYHLSNGTLAEWLRAEGAPALADLARNAMHEGGRDQRAALEAFLIGTGLVARPHLVAQPGRVDLGYILSGETGWGALRFRRGRGRGYLYGTLNAEEPWLDAEPRSFAGSPADVVVRADTERLLISATPYQADLMVHCSASAEPIAIPVHFRVVAMPPPIQRYLVRPLGLGALGALVGAVAGMSMAWLGLPVPGMFAALAGPLTWWGGLFGLLWGICGLVRAVKQPPAWPLVHTAARWVGWTCAWAVILALVALGLTWAWSGPDEAGAGFFGQEAAVWTVIVAAACAVAPGTITAVARQARPAAADRAPRRPLRAALVPALGVLLVLALLAGVPLLRPVWQGQRSRDLLAGAGQATRDIWSGLDRAANALLDSLYLRYYDQRAPVEVTPAPAPDVTAPETGAAAP